MRVLLTGASTGIGKAILTALLTEGHSITVVGRNKPEATHVDFVACDLSNESEVQALCQDLKGNHRTFDALINNAGGGLPARFEDLEIKDTEKCMMLNFHAPLFLIQAVLPKMVGQHHGRIINISSVSARRGTPYLFGYSAAKSALNSLTQSLSRTYSRHGISVNSVCPGGIDTEMSHLGREKISEFMRLESTEYEKRMQEMMGLGSLIPPDAVASTVTYLLKQESAAITGQCINICGNLELS